MPLASNWFYLIAYEILSPNLYEMKRVTIYTDGSSIGNPGPGGWAALLIYKDKKREISGGELSATNNQMEIMAAIQALEILKTECEVDLYTDSEYLRQGITKWIHTWLKNDWKAGSKKPVKNIELWQRLNKVTKIHKINWQWVKGHSGNKFNEIVDKLAYGAAKNMRK